MAQPINRPTATDRLPAVDKTRFSCPHCETFAAQTYVGLLWQPDGSHAWMDGWSAHRCEACKEPIIWRQFGANPRMIYPASAIGEMAAEDMPDDVQAIFNEARSVAGVSRRSAAALLRLALQMLIDQLEPGSGAINVKISKLVQRGLHPYVQQAMDVLRVVGNNAVHPGQIDLDEDPAIVPGLFRLLNAIVDQMISVPKHVQSLFDGLPQQARDVIAQRDGTTQSASNP